MWISHINGILAQMFKGAVSPHFNFHHERETGKMQWNNPGGVMVPWEREGQLALKLCGEGRGSIKISLQGRVKDRVGLH